MTQSPYKTATSPILLAAIEQGRNSETAAEAAFRLLKTRHRQRPDIRNKLLELAERRQVADR
jgi:hypothetical protein